VVLGMRLPFIESSVSNSLKTAVGINYNDTTKVGLFCSGNSLFSRRSCTRDFLLFGHAKIGASAKNGRRWKGEGRRKKVSFPPFPSPFRHFFALSPIF